MSEHCNCNNNCTKIIMLETKVLLYETLISQKLGINFSGVDQSPFTKDILKKIIGTLTIDPNLRKTSIKENRPKKKTQKYDIVETKIDLETILKQLILDINIIPIPKKQVVEIKNIQKKLMKFMSLQDYTKSVNNLIKQLEIQLEKTSIKIKKLYKIILNILGGIDSRLVEFDKYTDICVDFSDLSAFKSMIFDNSSNIIFSGDVSHILNYSLVVCPMNECLSFYIKLYSIVKFNGEFYILSDKNNLTWKHDCHLSSIGSILYSSITSFLILTFRKYYNNFFSDNDYREDFIKQSSIFETEGSSIITKLKNLINPLSFIMSMQKLVPEQTPSAKDTLSSQTMIDIDHFQDNHKQSSPNDFFNQLFDTKITLEQINKLLI